MNTYTDLWRGTSKRKQSLLLHLQGAAEIAVEIMDNNSDIGIADGVITKVKAIYTAHPQTDGSIFLPLTFNPDNTMYSIHLPASYLQSR